jgi:hypothetical protein
MSQRDWDREGGFPYTVPEGWRVVAFDQQRPWILIIWQRIKVMRPKQRRVDTRARVMWGDKPKKQKPIDGRCANCGHPRTEHSYNGACYGLCGEFVSR